MGTISDRTEEPLTVAGGTAGVGLSRDALLGTKLHVPRLHETFVPRPRLLELLDAGPPGRLVVVSAPAGFGKSALLADWVRRRPVASAWLSLDAADSDPVRFWRHVLAALDNLDPGISRRLGPLLGPPVPASFVGFVTAVVNELDRSESIVEGNALVLDDFHAVDSPSVVEAFTYFVQHRPRALRLLVGSRIDPPLPLARLRARGELMEVRADQLRFTPDESASLLRGAVGTEMSRADVAALTARTEGWAAGLQLAGLSLRGTADPAGFIANFSGSHRFVLDYLTEEVLEHQPAEVTEFLLRTSVLDRLSGQLCDALTGRPGGQQMLEHLERTNLFLIPLDDVRGWWRYHHLFADLLRARLLHQDPDRIAHLHTTASTWYEEHGFIDAAVDHAGQAGDIDRMADLVERHADHLLLRSQGSTIQRWLSALPEAVIAVRPRLLLARARLLLLSGRADEGEAVLDAAEHALVASPDEADDYAPTVGPGASLLANVPATIALDRAYLAELRGDADAAAAYAAHALASAKVGEWMLRSHAGGYFALARWLQGRLPEAERLLVASIARWQAAGERYLVVRGYHHLGQIRRAMGRLDEAADAYRLAIDAASPAASLDPTTSAATLDAPSPATTADLRSPAAGVGYVGLAELAYEQGDLAEALRHAEVGIELSRQLAFRQPLASGLAILAWIQQARGEGNAARVTMDEAVRLGLMHGVTSVLNPVPALWARLRLAQGDLATAAAWTRERGIEASDEPGYTREPDHLVLARVLLAQGRAERAEALLGRLYAAALDQHRLGSVVEIEVLRSLALFASGDRAGAVRMAAQALARAQGFVRVFADEGEPMRTVLRELVAAQKSGSVPAEPAAGLRRVLSAFDAEPGHPSTDPEPAAQGTRRVTHVPGLVEQLTARELEVLHLLATGRSNRDIATTLFVSVDTVKKHVSRVLDKLGAANRTEAVARARDLDLVR